MKLAFPVATPDTADPGMLALRGELESSFETLRRLGYEGTELMVRDPLGLDPVAIAGLADGYGLTVGAVSTGQLRKEDGLSLCSPDETKRREAVARMKGVMDFADALDAQVNIGTVRGHLPDREAARRSFDELLAYSNTRLAIEPQTRWVINWLNTIPETLEWIGASRMTVLFDLYHARLEEVSVYASLIRARDKISWVQISDSNRKAPGMGSGDLAEPLRVLDALDYTGFVSVECLPQPTAAEAAAQAIGFLRR